MPEFTYASFHVYILTMSYVYTDHVIHGPGICGGPVWNVGSHLIILRLVLHDRTGRTQFTFASTAAPKIRYDQVPSKTEAFMNLHLRAGHTGAYFQCIEVIAMASIGTYRHFLLRHVGQRDVGLKSHPFPSTLAFAWSCTEGIFRGLPCTFPSSSW